MKFKSYIPVVALFAAVSLTACQDDYENVENRIYDKGALSPSTVLIDGMTDSQTINFSVNMVSPLDTDIDITYGVDFSLLTAYNAIYSANAVELPESCYKLVQPTATIKHETLTSSEVSVEINDINSLDRNTVYVLPLTVVSSPVPVLESQKTRFIVVRGAALVNVACNMVENNAALVNATSASGLSGLTEMTFQCIFYVDEWGGSDSNIQSIAGIEGSWLLRISDSGLPANQLQFVTPSGNLTSDQWQLKDKTWVRMTFTWNAASSEATLYVDGAKKATVVGRTSQGVNWASDGFYIGKSWNDNRWLNGNICEVRVWNRLLSDAEIADEIQPYAVPVDSEGLVTYWKFNEGAGTLVRDYANGYDLQLAKTPKWVETSLPE